MPNAEREPKSPKQAKTNRSAIQANRSVPCTQVSLKLTPVSLNIPQVSLKRPRLACLRLALSNGNGFACFGDFVSRSAFAKLPLPILIPSQSVLTFGSPQLEMHSYGPNRYINYANFHYTPVNCYLLFMSFLMVRPLPSPILTSLVPFCFFYSSLLTCSALFVCYHFDVSS